jgi:hypothetical protein
MSLPFNFKNYSWSAARGDLAAGATVAAIAIPQAIAYALIAGQVRPLLGHRRYDCRVDFEFLVAPDQWPHQCHLTGGL